MTTKSGKKTVYFASWILALAAFWLLLSGYLKPLLLCFGVASVALVVLLLRHMDNIDKQPQKLPLSFAFFRYSSWLMGQIVLSSIEVTKLIWGNSKNLSPAIEKLPVTSSTGRKRVLYANSITLTPGTLSVDVDDDHVTIHALNEKSLDVLRAGKMAKKIATVPVAKN
ncbi:Na+/H+ antiporter subunit E [Pseudomaricurvus alkylphenolicus]|uniref:Na+/H+ antiporter subunit E n=1 Tax=Pseudomaricurvus alkylphenolicus TaxID=1306991 RepID=UPI001423CF0E|nr:Na+/H+ antiporter subunit E [Pseudomaricurvus alkylphenolicus]